MGEEARNTYTPLKLSFHVASFMLSEFTIGLLSANTDCRTLLANLYVRHKKAVLTGSALTAFSQMLFDSNNI